MNGKQLIITAMLLMLLASPAFAAITLTWATPTNNASFKNQGANMLTLDFNVGFADSNNVAGNDYNIDLVMYRYTSGTSTRTTIATLENDANAYDFNVNKTSKFSCDVKNAVGTSGSCAYAWAADSSITDGNYCVDVNFVEYRRLEDADVYSKDKNAMTCFTVNNSWGGAAATRAVLEPAGIILAAGIAVMAIIAISMGADIISTMAIAGIALIAVTIIIMLFGFITAMI